MKISKMKKRQTIQSKFKDCKFAIGFLICIFKSLVLGFFVFTLLLFCATILSSQTERKFEEKAIEVIQKKLDKIIKE